jgi:hypothetical protein
MMMRYHHFLGIGHAYSSASRPTCAPPHSASDQETVGACEDDQHQISHPCPITQTLAGESEESDTDSINTIDNGWQGWDEGDEEDDLGGHESDEDLLDMDDMYPGQS